MALQGFQGGVKLSDGKPALGSPVVQFQAFFMAGQNSYTNSY